jgi:predicted permease
MSLISDARFAVNALRRRPAFANTVIVTLALGIGANTAVFSLVNAVLLKPLNVRDPQTLVSIAPATRAVPRTSFRTYSTFVGKSTSFRAISAYYFSSLSAIDEGQLNTVNLEFVTENYFSVLGVHGATGRTIAPSDTASPSSIAVLSEAYRRRRFGADSAAVGKQIRLNGRLFTVIGVAPASFRGIELTEAPDVWLPLSAISAFDLKFIVVGGKLNENLPILRLVGRLGPDVSRHKAESELSRLDQNNENIVRSQGTVFTNRPTVAVIPLTQAAMAVQDPPTAVAFVRLLFAVVVLTLVLACVNVASVTTLRTRERALELGVRSALGASAWRLARQLLVESLLLALAGGVLGLGAGMIMIHLLSGLTLPGGLVLGDLHLGIDRSVAAFALIASIVAAVAIGVGPAHSVARANVIDILRGNDGPPGRLRGRGPLVSIQVAISLVLVVGASLFIRSLQRSLSTDLGFDTRPLAAVSVRPHYDGRHAENIRPYGVILTWMRKEPGISAVAVGTHVPLSDRTPLPFTRGTKSDADREAANAVMMPMVSVSADYFRTLGIPLVMGRQFDDASDATGAPRVTMLNESAARAFWPNESPLGKQISLDHAVTYTVVGVVRDTKYRSLQDHDVPFAFAPLAQEDLIGFTSFIVRSDRPRAALAVLERVVRSVAPDLEIPDSPRGRPRLVTEQLLSVLAPQRFGATLLSIFAFIALSVAAVGIYGGVAYVVISRTREIGIRMALGAQRVEVLRLILWEVSLAVSVGAVMGITGAMLAAGLVRHLLSVIGPTDWLSYAGAVAVVLGVAVTAAAIPGVRGARVDPSQAIRIFT